ncbi:MAG: bifunctional diaminohydroxyphosphoribosylaminopyrimidine deaminase/5-amino-6-(5-phosphoribosylamino)uracil reductase RibD, partial [Bacteroidia bacterium]|nr:bifunctional diaminohydroxyphosphoribosylaminopyrimidine deaminase/5-amino-6-(5-phosphoribosylamino)uracil reductase RibD [Bacteroidia bacterium]
LEHRVKRVVISNVDPNPIAVGGAERLRKSGVAVTTGALEADGHELNRRFFKWISKKQPYIILKWAQTADGFMAKENFDSKWISNELSRQRVHQWRTQEDAVLVGRRTAFHDNPQLNVRAWTGRNPVRVVIDRYLTLSDKLHLFDGSQPTIVFNVLKHEEHPNLKLLRLDEDRFLDALIQSLANQNIQSLIVEGGAHTLIQFIESGLWDEARIFVAPKHFHKGIKAPVAPGALHGV